MGGASSSTCRDPDAAVDFQALVSEHPDVSIRGLDVTAAEQIADLANALHDEPLDLIVNNAGEYLERWGQGFPR